MLFYAKDLIEIAPFGRDTYFRRMRELKEDKKFKLKLSGNYIAEEDAEKIADKLGFLEEWRAFVQKQKKSKD